MGKMGFFGASLVAAIPAGFMVYLVVMAFMSESAPEGILMVMVGSAGLMGLIIALIIPGYILMFVSKSGVIAPPKPKEKKAKKSKKKKGEEDSAEEEDFEEADLEADEFGDTGFDDAFDETVVSESGGDEWDDFEEKK